MHNQSYNALICCNRSELAYKCAVNDKWSSNKHKMWSNITKALEDMQKKNR